MNNKHDIRDLDLLYEDAKKLINEFVSDKIDGNILKTIDKSINDIKECWHGQDSIIQINKLIDVKNLLIDNRDILGNIGVYISMLVKNYRDAQNINSAILPTLTQLTYTKMNKVERIKSNSFEVYMNSSISNVVNNLNSFTTSLREFDDNVAKVKNSITNNWLEENENKNYAIKMFSKFSLNLTNIINNVKEIIKCINTSIDNYNFSVDNNSMPSLESMFSVVKNKDKSTEEKRILDSIEKNFQNNKQMSNKFNEIIVNEVKKDLISKGIIE